LSLKRTLVVAIQDPHQKVYSMNWKQFLLIRIALGQGTVSSSVDIPTTVVEPPVQSTSVSTFVAAVTSASEIIPATTTVQSSSAIVSPTAVPTSFPNPTFPPLPTETIRISEDVQQGQWSLPFTIFVICLGVLAGFAILGGLGYLIWFKTTQKKNKKSFDEVFGAQFKPVNEQDLVFKNQSPTSPPVSPSQYHQVEVVPVQYVYTDQSSYLPGQMPHGQHGQDNGSHSYYTPDQIVTNPNFVPVYEGAPYTNFAYPTLPSDIYSQEEGRTTIITQTVASEELQDYKTTPPHHHETTDNASVIALAARSENETESIDTRSA
jgi:hypothetical protein